jgi:hypothetical protein
MDTSVRWLGVGKMTIFGHKTLAWGHWGRIGPKLKRLRQRRLSHREAYDMFNGENAVPGLDASYFTKLIYFFSPPPRPAEIGFYIMDQWVAKSVNLLTQSMLIQMPRTALASPSRANTHEDYEACCREIEAIASELALPAPSGGDQVEERLMSHGGRHPGAWRRIVRHHWPTFEARRKSQVCPRVASQLLLPRIGTTLATAMRFRCDRREA